MTEEKKAGAPKKPAVVVSGRTVMTKRGIARNPAPITMDMLKGGKTEFYKLLHAGVLKYPEKVAKFAADGTQLDFEKVAGPEEPGEPGEPGEPEEAPKKKSGIKRK